MRTSRLLLSAALLGAYVGCSSSHGSSAAAQPMPTQPPAYVSTIATLVQSTNETADPADVATLNLDGLDSADDTAFNTILGN